jgi:hypothetical protein
VQLLSKKQQSKTEKDCADACISILFDTTKTEHWGSFAWIELGTKLNMKNMTNFAPPLVIIMWHRMLQEYFWTNSDKTFFDLGVILREKKSKKTCHMVITFT